MCSHMVKSKYCVSLLQRRLPCVGYQVSKKMASKVAVRSIEGEERMQICLKYGHDGKQEKTFNLLRLQNEEIGKTLARLQTSIVQKFSKGKRRKKAKENKSEAAESSSAHQTEDADEYIEIGLFREKEKLDDSVLNKDGWRHGDILQIAENWMPIILNPPTVKNVRLQECLMAGFPVFPQYELEFADLDQCVFSWFVGKPQSISDDSTAQGEPQKPEAVEMDSQRTKELLSNLKKESVDSWAEVSKERAFSPQSSHINHFLRLTLTPKNSEMSGEPQTVDSVGVIGAGPGMCPFEKRSQHTQELTPPGCVRIVSYNTLADLYADSDFSRTTLYPYCPPYALHIDYRKQLLLKELLGYNADLICLQEVDRKVFINDIKPTLATAGLESLHRTKAGEVCEGMVTCFRSSKFKLLGEHNISISEELQGNPVHEQLLTGISAKESLKEKVLSKTTILQVTVLGCVEDPQRAVCVANTHLYFHPKANHVRLVQIITCIQHLEGVVAQYASQGLDVSLVFCGDFNSSPPFGVNEYMTTGQIPADHDDWASGGDDEAIDLSEGFNHSFTLESGCGYPAYTNFVGGFCGTLDYIYIDDSRLEVKSVVPSPSDDDVTQYTALPSIVFPSDHIAQICEVEFIDD